MRTANALRILSVLVLCLGTLASRAATPQVPHKVFAHYMVCCPLAGVGTTDAEYRADIRNAFSHGIDGFALNVGAWTKEPYYQVITRALFRNVRAEEAKFQLFFSIDYLSVAEVVSMMRDYANDPAYLHVDGRPVLSTYGGQPAWAHEVEDALRAIGITVFFIPAYHYGNWDDLAGKDADGPEVYSARRALRENTDLDGFFLFGAGNPVPTLVRQIEVTVPLVQGAGKVAMVGICPSYKGFGPRNSRIFESDGFRGMQAQWEAAIAARADWVELVTWNDWSEATYLARLGSAGASQIDHPRWRRLVSHDAYLDASAFYIRWFKTGQKPAATADTLMFFYRLHPRDADAFVEPGPDSLVKGKPSGWERLDDEVEITSFLTRAVTLDVDVGGVRTTVTLQPGVSNEAIPMRVGAVRLTATRGGVVVGETAGPDISLDGTRSNFNEFSGEMTLR